MPASVPLKPLTDETDSLVKRSEGNTFAIVVKQAYENVESPKNEVIRYRLTVKIVGISEVRPCPQKQRALYARCPATIRA